MYRLAGSGIGAKANGLGYLRHDLRGTLRWGIGEIE